MTTAAGRREAVAELIGGICYALLRVYQLTAANTTSAPTVGLAESQARFASEEFERFRRLRDHLTTLTDDPEGAMDTFRAAVDAFYEAARPDRWLESQTFHFVGNSITTDFAEIVAGRLGDGTAAALREALTGRTEQEGFALQQIARAIEQEGQAARDRIRHFAAHLVGEGLNRLRDALLASNTLEVALGGSDAVKELVLELLGRHRERLERLGLEPLDD